MLRGMQTRSAGALTVEAPALWLRAVALPTRLANRLQIPVGLLVLAIGLRIALSPLQHTWDSQTWWDAAAQLSQHANPFEAIRAPFVTAQQMTDLARGSGQSEYFEYWAYPPGILLLWWPVVRLYTLLSGPLTPVFAAPDTFTAVPMPFILSLGLKLPIMAADLACAALLTRMAGQRAGRWWLFNPYVLLASAWTFDSIMVALLLAGLLAAARGRWALSGGLLGVGAAVKFVPAVLVPVICLWALRASHRPLRSALAAGFSSIATFAVICGPWWQGVAYVLSFHGGRPGGGMSWQSLWSALQWLEPLRDFTPMLLYGSAQIGYLTLSGALLVGLWLTWLWRLDLVEMCLGLMLAYLVGTKLVNEVYALPALALALVVCARRPSANGTLLIRVLWCLPLLFALVNVPAWGFFLAPAAALGLVNLEQARVFHDGYVLTYRLLSPCLTLIGALFQGACAWGVWILRGKPDRSSAWVGKPLAAQSGVAVP